MMQVAVEVVPMIHAVIVIQLASYLAIVTAVQMIV